MPGNEEQKKVVGGDTASGGGGVVYQRGAIYVTYRSKYNIREHLPKELSRRPGMSVTEVVRSSPDVNF